MSFYQLGGIHLLKDESAVGVLPQEIFLNHFWVFKLLLIHLIFGDYREV